MVIICFSRRFIFRIPCWWEFLPDYFFLLLAVYFSRRYSFRWIFGSVAYLLVFGAGTGGMNQVLQQTVYAFQKQECVYRAILTDRPDEKEHTFLCPAFLTEKQDSVGVVPVNRKVLLYISKDSLAGSLRNGDELVLMARVSPPSNNGNPDEFDYARYLRYRGIGGVAFVAEGKWQIIGHRMSRSFRQIALDCRDRILDKYRALKFESDEFAVLAALTVGYKEELGEDIRETYSVSGASHVLALSGLHIGFFIYAASFTSEVVAGECLGGEAISCDSDNYCIVGICFHYRAVPFCGSFGYYVFIVGFVGLIRAYGYFT